MICFIFLKMSHISNLKFSKRAFENLVFGLLEYKI
jgi:hypothetical protein